MPPSAVLFRNLVLPRVSTTVLFWALRARSSRSRSGGRGLSARLSVHQGAALALARRGLSFQEKPAMPVGLVPVGNGGHVTFVLPVRNRAKHVWSHWADILRNSRAAHGAHFQSGGALLAPEPLSPAMRTLRSIRGVSVESRQANKDGFSGAVRQQNCSAAVLDDHIPY